MNRHYKSFLTILLGLAICACGCAASASTSAKEDAAIVPELPPYNGPKARIAIGKFTWDVGGTGATIEIKSSNDSYNYSVTQQSNYMNGLDEMLTTALMESNRYRVLENSDLGELKDEIQLGEEGYVEQSSAVEKGGWKGADLIVMASITEWEPDAGGNTIGGGGLTGGLLGGLGVSKKSAKLGMHIRVVDSRTRETLVSKAVVGESSSTKLTGGGILFGGAGALGGIFSEYKNTPMGSAISVCIAKAVELVATNTPQEYFKY